MVDGWIWKKGRLFFILQCWLINLDWMVKLENHYFAIIITKIDFGKEWSVDAEYKPDILTRSRMFCCSVTQSCPNPMDCSTPGFPVLHYLLEFLKLVSIESMMPSNHFILCRPLILPSIFLSIRVLQWVSSLRQLARVLELQHQSFQWIFRVDFL